MFDYIQKTMVEPLQAYYKPFGLTISQKMVTKDIIGMHEFLDLQGKTLILLTEDLSVMGDDKKTLIIDSPNNTLVTSPADFASLGLFRHQPFTDFMDIYTKSVEQQGFIPYSLVFLELIPTKI